MLRSSGFWLLVVGFWLLVACGDEPTAKGQEPIDYVSPVDYDIVLAGNFGEPRPWHFHGGIDVKTDNQEGKQIFSIADGYVSRITVNKYGFGNAIYVNHPDGLTSVYCHLKRFADKYEQLFERTGWRDTLDFRYVEGQLPVKGGDMIALSGNTGHSTGPHLHLELHDTKTWVMIDPMEKLAKFIADTVAPQAHSFMAVPVVGEGLFNGGATKQTFGFGQPDVKKHSTTWTLSREFTAWGRVGFALWADDYSEATVFCRCIGHSHQLSAGSKPMGRLRPLAPYPYLVYEVVQGTGHATTHPAYRLQRRYCHVRRRASLSPYLFVARLPGKHVTI